MWAGELSARTPLGCVGSGAGAGERPEPGPGPRRAPGEALSRRVPSPPQRCLPGEHGTKLRWVPPSRGAAPRPRATLSAASLAQGGAGPRSRRAAPERGRGRGHAAAAGRGPLLGAGAAQAACGRGQRPAAVAAVRHGGTRGEPGEALGRSVGGAGRGWRQKGSFWPAERGGCTALASLRGSPRCSLVRQSCFCLLLGWAGCRGWPGSDLTSSGAGGGEWDVRSSVAVCAGRAPRCRFRVQAPREERGLSWGEEGAWRGLGCCMPQALTLVLVSAAMEALASSGSPAKNTARSQQLLLPGRQLPGAHPLVLLLFCLLSPRMLLVLCSPGHS